MPSIPNIELHLRVESADDGSALFGVKSTAGKHKGWINRTLEESAVPTMWLTNTIEYMDPAFVRRFDMIFELPIPPRRQRAGIVNTLCSEIAPAETIDRIADSEHISPAVIARASKVITAVKGDIPEGETGEALELLVESTLMAQGYSPLSATRNGSLPEYYDPEIINSDINLTTLAENIEQAKTGRLCIYGPPGTGKTAYAHWLASKMGIALHVKRASDLIDMWVGGTEKNIARAFRDAEKDKAILLIDEVDSFLQDRRKANVSWEVTAVNEMLTQMESFSGIFMASTNLVDNLDQAALRRFDMKAKFDYLKPEQSWSLFCKLSKAIGIEVNQKVKERIYHLGVLTPGDYNVITRRHRFQPFSCAQEIARVLEEECHLKEDGRPKRTIGFIQD